MNHIYRVVYNAATNTYQAVPENSTGKHKTASEKSSCAVSDVSEKGAFFSLKPMVFAMAMGLSNTGAWAAPTGGHISAGDASIAQHGKITNIQQNSQKAAINWQTFGIKADETVNFKQPNAQAVILNRVIGNEKSVIDGAMNANGKVFISNPNGMIIGKNAQINVGALLATTAKIKDQDFMNGFFKFDEATGDITHLGDIKVPTGGVVALIAPIVANKGNITAPQGKVLLASAEQFSITLPDNGQFAYTLDRGTLQGLVDNGGAILADGGYVILTAKGTDVVKKSLIKHTGKIEANTVQNKNGVIELLGDLDNTRLEASGSLKAEAEQGDGGFIETSAAELGINDLQVSTQSKYDKTGTWLIDPKDFTVAPSGGDMTGKKVEEGLQANNVVLKSRDGAKEGKGDVIINDEISWDKNTLTLDADNDIHINKTLNGTGTAKLALEYGQGTAEGKYKAIVDGKETELDNDYYLDKNTPLKDRTVKVNLPEGKNFSTKKGSNGEVHGFDVIHKMPEIVKNANGDWESQFTERNIALGKDMDVGYTKDYAGFAGWQLAKGNIDDWGHVAGLGHTVSNLTLHSKKHLQHTGLFQKNRSGNIRDIGVHNAQVRSEGQSSGTGGLVGYGAGSQISNSYATGSVSSSGDYTPTGGLVGYGYWSQISNSYATGSLSSSGYNAHTGGLVGYGSGSQISNSYATGSVSSSGDNAHTGGLVGSGSQISNSYATGSVSSSGDDAHTGGLVGWWGSQISNSYATGSVSSSGDYTHTGGLVGYGDGYQISNSYASNPHLSATGEASFIGGLVGELNYSGVNYKNSFFNQDKHPNLPAIGKIESNPSISNVTGKTESQLKDRTTFEGWDFDKVWYMNEGSMPKLRAFATPLAVAPTTPNNPINQQNAIVKAPELSKTYDGKAVESVQDLKKLKGWKDDFDAVGLLDNDTVKDIFKEGTLTIDPDLGSWKGAKDAGLYSMYAKGELKDEYNQKYIIDWYKGSNVLTIYPKKITVTALNNFSDDLSETSRKNIGFVVKGLVGDDAIFPDINVRYINPKTENSITKHEIHPIKESIQFSKGSANNYDIETKHGSLIDLPENRRKLKNFPKNDMDFKNNPDITYIADKLAEHQDEWLAADVVYDNDFGKERLEKIGSKLSLIEHKDIDNGLQMALYKHNDSNKYIISYRGTEFERQLKEDGAADLVSVFTIPAQYHSAFNISKEMIKNIKSHNPNAEFVLTGHSLGGGLSQYVAAKDAENLKSVTFNPAPIRLVMYRDLLKNSACGTSLCNKDKAISFRFDNDVLIKINPHLAKLGVGILDGHQDIKTNGLIGSSLYTNFLTENTGVDHTRDHIHFTNQSLEQLNKNKSILEDKDNKIIKESNYQHVDNNLDVWNNSLNEHVIHSVVGGVTKSADDGGIMINVIGDINRSVIDTHRKLGKGFYEITHTTTNDLRDLMGKYYKDLPDNNVDLVEKLRWSIGNENYSYDFQGNTLTATVRATEQFRMVYMAYQLGLIEEDDAEFLFNMIKDNHIQALTKKYDNTTEHKAKNEVVKTIQEWQALTFQMWKERHGSFVGNDVSGRWVFL